MCYLKCCTATFKSRKEIRLRLCCIVKWFCCTTEVDYDIACLVVRKPMAFTQLDNTHSEYYIDDAKTFQESRTWSVFERHLLQFIAYDAQRVKCLWVKIVPKDKLYGNEDCCDVCTSTPTYKRVYSLIPPQRIHDFSTKRNADGESEKKVEKLLL